MGEYGFCRRSEGTKKIAMQRKLTKKIMVGSVAVGGGAPIRVQSMTNTQTSDIDATVKQILSFEKAGCDLSRSAINSLEDAKAIPEIKRQCALPFIADIQFDWRLALYAVQYGADAIRINPGNIGDQEAVKKIVDLCRDKNVPIRVGVNSGSVHPEMVKKYGGVNVQSLVYSALEEVDLIHQLGWDQIVVSIKSSSAQVMIEAGKLFSQFSDFPQHLGVTEAGPSYCGLIKSAVGIGSLLSQGIGDTIRVSLTDDPVEEVRAANEILKSLGLKKRGVNLISCPTCARTGINLIGLVKEAQNRLSSVDKNITVAIMGCPVNGPGEAREADIGIAGSKGSGVIFKKGKVLRQVSEDQLLDCLMEEVQRIDQ